MRSASRKSGPGRRTIGRAPASTPNGARMRCGARQARAGAQPDRRRASPTGRPHGRAGGRGRAESRGTAASRARPGYNKTRRHRAGAYRESDMASIKGTIKRLVSDKGFGFIAAGDGNEYFFHQSACSGMAFDDLREGQAVTFESGQGPKGPRAENVRLA